MADCAVPKGVNYDAWQGPAKVRPFNPNRFHYNWHWNWEYGNGEIGNNGPHMTDLMIQGLDKQEMHAGQDLQPRRTLRLERPG